jgi:hypothetical protein
MAFDPVSGCPLFLFGDTGVHRTACHAGCDSSCGLHVDSDGGNARGYNGLQLYDVAARDQDTGFDLYFGTQDNRVWGSIDSGASWPFNVGWEGYGIQPTRTGAGEMVTAVGCAPCLTSMTRRGLAGPSPWRGPPAALGHPIVIAPGVHMQYGQPSPPAIAVYVTSSSGLYWTPVGELPPFQPEGDPQVSGPPSAPVIFQAFRLPGRTAAGDLRIGLWRITGILGGTLHAEPVPGIGLTADGRSAPGSLLAYSWIFIEPVVFAVDPRDPDHILAADVDGAGGPMMRVTRDGGRRWDPDPLLTALLTGGEFQFSTPARPFDTRPWRPPAGLAAQPRVITFDPGEPRRIFVGTEAAGVIYSEDSGAGWQVMPGSRPIPAITDFAFAGGSVRVASYGRGLWTLRPPAFEPWEVLGEPAEVWRRPLFFTVHGTPVFDPDDPPCEICEVALVAQGRVRELTLDPEGHVEALGIDGQLKHFDIHGQPVQGSLQATFQTEDGAFAGCGFCRELAASGAAIRGLVRGPEGSLRYLVVQAAQ